MNEAYSEALKGAFSGEITNEEWKHVILPLLKQIKEAGGDIPTFAVDALKEGMEGNLNEGLTANFFWSLFRNSGDFGLQRTASETIEALNAKIERIVKEGHGETWYIDIAKLFGVDGVDLLSEDWKQDILSYAREAGLDDAFIEDLMKELGLSEDKKHEVEKHVEAAVNETLVEPVKQKSILESIGGFFKGLAFNPPSAEEPVVEIPKKEDLLTNWDSNFGWNTPASNEPISVPVQITIEPIMDSNELYQQIREKILNSDMPDTSVPLGQTFELWQNDDQETLQELRNAIDDVGIELAFEELRNFLNGDGWPRGKVGTPNITASVPTVQSTTGAFLNGSETVKTEAADPAQEAANVETGVRKGNSDLVGLIRDLIDVTRASNNRPISVTVSPSSVWGFHNVASGIAVDKVIG